MTDTIKRQKIAARRNNNDDDAWWSAPWWSAPVSPYQRLLDEILREVEAEMKARGIMQPLPRKGEHDEDVSHRSD